MILRFVTEEDLPTVWISNHFCEHSVGCDYIAFVTHPKLTLPGQCILGH